VTLAMNREERESFLAEPHVGVISIPEPDRGPLTVPIWYGYRPGADGPGELWILTERSSRMGRLLAMGTRLSLCAQSEAPPYRYVSVEGVVIAIDAADVARDTRPMAHRYLGPELGDRYVEATRGTGDAEGSVRVRIRPERWLSVDYRKQFAV
jgi:nitroimidazol reductase NimA-like FMN-containing flavoprotein (pyridoxamine 5'-phosphate oxidase superfamily)